MDRYEDLKENQIFSNFCLKGKANQWNMSNEMLSVHKYGEHSKTEIGDKV